MHHNNKKHANNKQNETLKTLQNFEVIFAPLQMPVLCCISREKSNQSIDQSHERIKSVVMPSSLVDYI